MSPTRLTLVVVLIALAPAATLVGPVAGAADTTQANERPLAEAGLDRSVTQGAAVVLDGAGSRDPDGEIVAHRWTVTAPDGTTVTPECPTCERTTFDATQAGEYAVTLTVEDDDGATDSDTLYVQVDPADPPNVSLSGPTRVTVDDTPEYTADLTPGDLRVSQVRWTVDGRLVANRSPTGADIFRPSLDTAGEYVITVTAVDTVGNVASDSLTVQVVDGPGSPDGPGGSSPTPPTAKFTLDQSTVCVADTVIADPSDSTDTDRVNGSPPDEAIDRTVWYVDGTRVATNDGTPPQSLSTDTPGDTRIRLVVRDDDGQRDGTSETVSVLPGDDPTCETNDPPVAVAAATLLDEDDGERRYLLDGSDSYDRDNPAKNGSEIDRHVWNVDGDRKFGERVETTIDSRTDVTLTVFDDEGDGNGTTVTLSPGSESPGGGTGDGGGLSDLDVEIVGQEQLTWTTGQPTVVYTYDICLGRPQVNDQPANPETLSPSDDYSCRYSVSGLKQLPEVKDVSISLDSNGGDLTRTGRTSGRIEYRTPDSSNTLYTEEQLEAELTVDVDITRPEFDSSPKRYNDIDSVQVCWEPSNPEDPAVPPDKWEDATENCPKDPSLSVPEPLDLTVQQEAVTAGPFENGETVTHEADVENPGLYEYSDSPAWTPDATSPSEDGSGWEYTWTVTNTRDYSKQREVTASLTADGPKGYYSKAPNSYLSATSSDKVTVCAVGEDAESGTCSNDGGDDDGSRGDNGSDGDDRCTFERCSDPGAGDGGGGNDDGGGGDGGSCRDDSAEYCATNVDESPSSTPTGRPATGGM